MAKHWANTWTEIEDLGKGKFGATIHVGHRVFKDKIDGLYKKHKLTDERPTKDYVLIQSTKCCVEIYPYYAKYFDVNHEEVRLHEERWIVQRLFQAPDKWRDVDAYNPIINVEESNKAIKITIKYDTDYGELLVEYLQRDGKNLKHSVLFKNNSSGTETFRILQKWTGVVADEVNGEPITKLKSIQRDDLKFSKAGRLCVHENLSGFNPLPKPPPSLAGETLYCLNKQLKDAHELLLAMTDPRNIKPMTLFFTETPRHVLLGRNADINANVNTDYCEKQNMPIIRSNFSGRGYAYDKGDALYVVLSCPSEEPEVLLQTILSRTVNSFGVPTSISGDDIRCGDGRVGMTAPPTEEHLYCGWRTYPKN